MNVPYDYYKIFYYVVEYQSVSKAAIKLYSNQPNVSRSIKNLEGIVGFTLFERKGKGIVLTNEGRKLYEKIRPGIESIMNAETNIESEKNLRIGTITIQLDEMTICDEILVILSDFRKKHTGIKIEIEVKKSDEIIDNVECGIADLGYIFSLKEEEKTDLEITKLKEDNLVLICSGEYIKYTNRELTFDELKKLPIISTPNDSFIFKIYDKYFARKEERFEPTITVDSIQQIVEIVKYGIGVAIVPNSLISSVGGVYKIKMEESFPKVFTYIVKKELKYLNPIQKELIKNSIKLIK